MEQFFFSIPFTGYRDDLQWNVATRRIRSTLQSILGSLDPDFQVIICGHEKPDLVELEDPRIHFIESLRPKPMDSTEFRRDKGRKRRANFRWIADNGGGHIMLLDADDHIHRNIVGFVRDVNHPFGHVLCKGYVFDLSSGNMAPVPGAWTKNFSHVCGSSHILRLTPDELKPDGIVRKLKGPHSKIFEKSKAIGRSLNAIDWPAAIYVLGGDETISSIVLRTPNRQAKLKEIIAQQAVEIGADLITDFSLQPLIDECSSS